MTLTRTLRLQVTGNHHDASFMPGHGSRGGPVPGARPRLGQPAYAGHRDRDSCHGISASHARRTAAARRRA